MSLTLYPYVYLLARAAFAEQAPSTYDAARTLGAGRGRAFCRVLVPLARPSLAAGLALVMMEVLTDFATVQYFGVQTVSVGVYMVWKGSYDFGSAVQLASLVMLFAVAVLAGERLMRGRARFTQQGGHGRGLQPERLLAGRGLLATAVCLLALAAAVFVPVGRLIWWAVDYARSDGAAGTGLGLRAGLLQLRRRGADRVADVRRARAGHRPRGPARWRPRAAGRRAADHVRVRRAGRGHRHRHPADVRLARPTPSSGLGVEGGTGLLVTGSVVGILYAYAVRFLGPAYQAVDASYQKVPRHADPDARSASAPGRCGCSARVHGPLVRSGVAVALVLVAIDAIKELPLVLLLRPFGFTTVSVWVYQLAKENLWGLAALPALVIIALATVPVFILFRQVRAADAAGARRPRASEPLT